MTEAEAEEGDASLSDATSGTVDVAIEEGAFNPDVVEITVGTTVTWTNRDAAPHSVSSHDDVFASTGLVTDETFSYTFEEAGAYTYFSQYNPAAEGTVIVTEP